MPVLSFNHLSNATEKELIAVGMCLWSWPLCDDCSMRHLKLQRFFEHYKTLTTSYEAIDPKYPALRTHGDILTILEQLKRMPDTPRLYLRHVLFNNIWRDRSHRLAADQDTAINLAVKVMTMVNCSAQDQSPALLEHGAYQVPWRDDVSLSNFIQEIFPLTDHPGLNDADTKLYLDIKPSLMARKLKKRIGLKIRPTDDLRSHLKLDQRTNTLDVYHHVAFLKEHLRLTKDHPKNLTIAESLKLGALPRQLALECLDSIQKILFPLSDAKSRSLLQSLTTKSSFDPDCLRFESASIRNPDEKDIKYYYFGSRLVDLYDELQDPRARGWLQQCIERRSGARYTMMATLAGVLFALVLGMAGLAISSYQAWVGYQQWQHPVNQSQ